MRTALLLFLGLLTASGCSPRNGLNLPVGDDDDSAAAGACSTTENSWPTVLPEYLDYEGEGAQTGQFINNVNLLDQHGERMCLSQLLGTVLIVDASTRWCGPCNKAAAESAVLWEHMKEIGPSWIATLMVQDSASLPATLADVEWWAEEYEIEYPVLLDENQQTAATWDVIGYPLFLFIAPNGEVIERRESRPSEADILDFVTFAVEEWADDLRPPE